MEIVLQDKESARYETGDVVTGFLKVPDGDGLKASEVSIALVGQSEVKWVPPENFYGPYRVYPSAIIYDTKRNLEIVQEINDQGRILQFNKILIWNWDLKSSRYNISQ